MRRVRLVLWGLAGLALIGFGGLWAYRAMGPSVTAAVEERAAIGGPFTLVDGSGRTVTDEDLAGEPFVIFFGFTHCPDVCPTSLFEIAGWIDALGPAADDMRFLFVTVDPERDTPEAMSRYVSAFSEEILPLTGSREQIDEVIDGYRVYARKVPLDDGGYTMDHSAFIYLMDEKGRYEAHIAYGEDRDGALSKLRGLAEDA